jgi:hypothetical protein
MVGRSGNRVATTVQTSASGFGAGRWLAHALDPSAGGPAAAACDPRVEKIGRSVGAFSRRHQPAWNHASRSAEAQRAALIGQLDIRLVEDATANRHS